MHYPIFSEYVSRVSDTYSLSPNELFIKSKRRDIVDARQLLYFLCSKTPIRIRYIQQYMKENGYEVGHSTIIHGIKRVEENESKKRFAEASIFLSSLPKKGFSLTLVNDLASSDV
tara:strand:- start:2478 stop:2822 length:345 start_codon:yes stop_codon:yes gene_type:complete